MKKLRMTPRAVREVEKLRMLSPNPAKVSVTFSVGGWVKQRIEIFDPLLSINPGALIAGLDAGTYLTSVEGKQIEEAATGRPVAKITTQDLETEYYDFEKES